MADSTCSPGVRRPSRSLGAVYTAGPPPPLSDAALGARRPGRAGRARIRRWRRRPTTEETRNDHLGWVQDYRRWRGEERGGEKGGRQSLVGGRGNGRQEWEGRREGGREGGREREREREVRELQGYTFKRVYHR